MSEMKEDAMVAMYRRDIAHYTERAEHYASNGNTIAWAKAEKRAEQAKRRLKEYLYRSPR